jgi:hypothetical protein
MALDDCALTALDPVRERFAQEYHSTGNASEALRRAKPYAAKWKAETVHKRASEMLLTGEVRGAASGGRQETRHDDRQPDR